MSDKKVTVEVEIKDSNKAGPGLKQTEEQLSKVEQAAEKATEAVKNLNDASAESGPSGPKTADLEGPAWVARQNMLLRQDVAKRSAAQTVNLEGPAWVARQAMLLREEAARLSADAGGGGDGTSPLAADGGIGGRLTVKPGNEKPEAMRVFVVNWPARGTGMSRVSQDLQDAKEEKKDGKTPAEKAREGFRNLQIAALAAAGAASAAVAATAPATWATFAGSLQLVSGEFANMLIPAFVKASYYLQQGADWVRSWDDSTKSWVSTIAVWSTGIVIGTGVLAKLGSVALPVAKAVYVLGLAVRTTGVAIGAFAVANPWVAGLTAAVGVVGYLTNGFGLLSNSIERAGTVAEQARQRISRLQDGGAFSRNDYESIPLRVRSGLETALPRDREMLVDLYTRQRERERDSILATNPSSVQTNIENILAMSRDQLAERFFRDNPNARVLGSPGQFRRGLIESTLRESGLTAQQARERTSELTNLAPVLGMRLTNPLESGTPLVGEDARIAARQLSMVARLTEIESETLALRRVRETGIPGLFEGLTVARPMQPRSFSSGEQFYGDILQNILGRDPMQERLLQQQMRNDERLWNEGVARIRAAFLEAIREGADPFDARLRR